MVNVVRCNRRAVEPHFDRVARLEPQLGRKLAAADDIVDESNSVVVLPLIAGGQN